MADIDYLALVADLTKAKFIRVCIVNKSFQVVGASGQNAAPCAWKNDKGVLINENQMLKDDWKGHIKDATFHFWKKPWTNFGQESDAVTMNMKGKASPSLKGENAVLVRDRETVWIIASFNLGTPMAGKKKGQEHVFKSMSTAIDALEKVLEDHGLGADE